MPVLTTVNGQDPYEQRAALGASVRLAAATPRLNAADALLLVGTEVGILAGVV